MQGSVVHMAGWQYVVRELGDWLKSQASLSSAQTHQVKVNSRS